MTILWFFDVLAVSAAVAVILFGVWLAIACILLSIQAYYEHVVEVNHRMMDRFSQTTNYPMYQRYQEKAMTAAGRLNFVYKLLGYITFL